MASVRKVKIDPGLYLKAAQRARELGYPGVDEYVVHVLEKDLGRSVRQAAEAEVDQQLRGLGYIT